MDREATGHNQPSSLIDGRYRLSRRLGDSTRSTVWCATDERLNRPVLLRFAPAARCDPRAVARQCVLADDRLACILDIEAGARPGYVVTEWIEGDSLADPAAQRFETARIIEIVAEAAAAVAVAHAADLVHGRLDAGSIVLSESGLVKIAGVFVTDGDPGARDDVNAVQELLRTALRGRRLQRGLRRLLRRQFTTAAGFAEALAPYRAAAVGCRFVSPEPVDNQHRFATRRAREVMATDVVTVSEDTPVLEVAAILAASRCAAVPVVDSTGRVTGLVSSSDLARWRLDVVPA